jgi:hypothetical protein
MGRAAVVVVLLALLAGCTAKPEDLGPLPKVTHPQAEVPKDRDEPAVLAALRQTDACALLGPDAKVYPANVTPKAKGPHRCAIRRDDNGDEIEVVLGDLFGPGPRFGRELITIGGAKAYQWVLDGECLVHLPVSFRLAIKFWGRKGAQSAGSDEICSVTRGFAAYAVTRLSIQDSPKPGLPLADWDACQLLTAALGANPDKYALGINESLYGVDSCGADPREPERASPAVGLTIRYGGDPAAEGDVRTIGGMRVRVYQFSDACTLAWSNGNDVLLELRAPDCARAEGYAAAAMARLRDPAPPAGPLWRPLTYRPSEPDVGVAGACLDLSPDVNPQSCQPYVQVPVPAGDARVIQAAEADLNINCAIARDGVARHFGDLRPVTFDRGCAFVEPSHAVKISVYASRTPAMSDGRPVTVAGHEGRLMISRGDGRSDHKLSLSVGDKGSVLFEASLRPTRGTGDQARPDDSPASKLELFAADVMAKYFTG